jgi:hypothetical protein
LATKATIVSSELETGSIKNPESFFIITKIPYAIAINKAKTAIILSKVSSPHNAPSQHLPHL